MLFRLDHNLSASALAVRPAAVPHSSTVSSRPTRPYSRHRMSVYGTEAETMLPYSATLSI